MSEDRTRHLGGATTFEERVLALFDRVFDELATLRAENAATRAEVVATRAEVAELRQRQDSFEEKVDRRLQETRPIWEAVLRELRTTSEDVETIKRDIRRVDEKFEVVVQEPFEHATDIRELRKRVVVLEDRKPS